jgi:hypothetical protein
MHDLVVIKVSKILEKPPAGWLIKLPTSPQGEMNSFVAFPSYFAA